MAAAAVRPRTPGFTLLELLVVLALLGWLATLSLPSMAALLLRRQVQAAAEALVADLRLARSEAIKRVTTVAVCASSDGLNCAATAAWVDGWLVFVDRDGNRRRDANEELLRVQQRPPGLASVGSATPANDRSIVSYQSTGWAKAAAQTLLFTAQGGAVARVVCISNQGRPVLRPQGQTACS